MSLTVNFIFVFYYRLNDVFKKSKARLLQIVFRGSYILEALFKKEYNFTNIKKKELE